jgi:hypothetical protein
MSKKRRLLKRIAAIFPSDIREFIFERHRDLSVGRLERKLKRYQEDDAALRRMTPEQLKSEISQAVQERLRIHAERSR